MDKNKELKAIIERAAGRNYTVVSESWGICYDCLEAEQLEVSGWAVKMGERLGLSPSTVYERVNATKMRNLFYEFYNKEQVDCLAEKGYSYFKDGWKWYQKGVLVGQIFDAIEVYSPIEKFRAEMSVAFGDGHETNARVDYLFRRLESLYQESEYLGLSNWTRKALKIAYDAIKRDIDLRTSVK